jgi:soluble lytic murein transglycosylase-like protein
VGSGLLSLQQTARAGAQIEEPLADSVRNILSTAIANKAPPIPEFNDLESRLTYLRWFGAMSERLRLKMPNWNERREFLQTIWYECRRAGLNTALVLGLIQVESDFRKHAVSGAGARGYMQVMPFWARQIGQGDPSILFHMQANLRFGCVILRHYMRIENNELGMALGRYNGSRGKAKYPNAVLSAQKKWDFVDTQQPIVLGAG